MTEIPPLSLTDFLLARIAEDEEVAHTVDKDARVSGDAYTMHPCHPQGWAERTGWVDIDPARVLADVEAKRRIVETSLSYGRYVGGDWVKPTVAGREEVLQHLASVYSDHPDYDEAWRA